jgi:DNA-binding NtrC family response regulator/tetratricopeptide (TPR) repeat protein
MSTVSPRTETGFVGGPPPEFDERAQSACAARFRTCPPETFLAELGAYVPRTQSQRTAYELYSGWALYDAGCYLDSRSHLIRALRESAPASEHRSLQRGLLGECYLRTGQPLRAERCVRRALSEGCDADHDRYLEAGHRFMLGRIQRFHGHLSHAKETFQEALATDPTGKLRVPILNEIAEIHLLRDELDDAERTLQTCRNASAFEREGCQGWTMALTEAPLALALGESGRAEQIVTRAIREYFPVAGERVRLLLTTLRAVVLGASGRERTADELLKEVLQHCELGGRNSDVLASAARPLAEVLQRLGRLAEAIETARLAARAGWSDDWIEWARALRIQGECQWALGSRAEARRAFREAASVHAGTQFLAERRVLAQTMERLGCCEIARPARADAAPEPRTFRLPLVSGQAFVSSDPRLIESIAFAARTDLPVLIEGETGTGKELVARLIHEMGPRAARPWVVIDCTTLPEALADAELFGARRGAFTGSISERSGLVAEADGGTLFLDELSELSPSIQAKLLRVLQDGTYRRVGDDRGRRVDLRVVAATNRCAQSEIEAGRLKSDLFYRLCGHRIFLQPLRARRGDIAALVLEFARRVDGVRFTPAALSWLGAQAWPGNARQLEMLVRLAMSAHPGVSLLDRQHFEAVSTHPEATSGPSPLDPGFPWAIDDLSARRREGERSAIQRALSEHRGVVRDAARHLGISRQALYKAMRRTGL